MPSILQAEFDANEYSKQWTVSERVAIGRALEAEIGSRQGQRNDLGLLADLPEVKGKETRELAAEKVGFKRDTYKKTKAIVSNGIPELIELIDDGDISINSAAIASSLSEDEQREIVEEIKHAYTRR